MEYLSYVLYGAAALFGIIIFFSLFFSVKQQSVAIIERFGKFLKVANPGLNVKIPLIDSIATKVSLRIQQVVVTVDTKTKDNVFVKVVIAVQYRVVEGKEFESYYKLQKPVDEITSYVLDVVRSQVPKMDLDDAFEKKDEIGKTVQTDLAASMTEYGYDITGALVTDIDPAESVKDAMNQIQTQTRLRKAAEEKGEAAKIIAVKAAEAEKETKKLNGEGIAAERIAIATGIKESVKAILEAGGETGSSTDAKSDVSAGEAMQTLLLTQYFDTMRAIGANGKATTIFLPHSPGGLADLRQQIAEAVMFAKQAPGPETPAT